MTRRLTQLTAEHRAAIPDHVARWIAVGHATGEADWDAFTAGAQACYGYAGLPWHGNVVRVPNPLVLALAAPIAALVLADRPVDSAVGSAVGSAVYSAVGSAVGSAVRRLFYRRLRGQWGVAWAAMSSYVRDVCGLELDGDLWDRDRAYAQAQSSAGWWWPHHQFVMVCDRPRELHLEPGTRAGAARLHDETGPAIRWSDGWALHFWHGVRVPADLIEGDGWDPDRILRERNTEIRRCAIERRGWHRFVVDASLAQVGAAEPDPGNPGRELRLYDVPAAIYDEPVRVLICENGSADRDGSRRTFGLTVPADVPDPITAAAWTYGIGRAEYAGLARRT